MTKGYKGCKGCVSLEGCYDESRSTNQHYLNIDYPYRIDHNDERIEECPCVACLIKMMCNVPCDPYKELWY